MKHGTIFFSTLVLVLSVSCMHNPGAGKPANDVTVEIINVRLSEKGLFIRFREIIPPGEKKEYREMFLTGYALSETEVSQHDYRLLIHADEPVLLGWDSVSWWDYLTRNLKKKDITELHHYGYGEDIPVYGVHKYNAMVFCNRLSAVCGLDEVYAKDWTTNLSKNGFRLPSETQWEYAAGGPDHTRYSFGDEFEKELYVFDTDMVQPVKSGRANGFGLFHMSGNVREWCQDLRNYTDQEVFPQNGITDPVGYTDGSQSAVRGGSFLDRKQERLGCTFRLFSDTNSPDYRMGIRVCLKTGKKRL